MNSASSSDVRRAQYASQRPQSQLFAISSDDTSEFVDRVKDVVESVKMTTHMPANAEQDVDEAFKEFKDSIKTVPSSMEWKQNAKVNAGIKRLSASLSDALKDYMQTIDDMDSYSAHTNGSHGQYNGFSSALSPALSSYANSLDPLQEDDALLYDPAAPHRSHSDSLAASPPNHDPTHATPVRSNSAVKSGADVIRGKKRPDYPSVQHIWSPDGLSPRDPVPSPRDTSPNGKSPRAAEKDAPLNGPVPPAPSNPPTIRDTAPNAKLLAPTSEGLFEPLESAAAKAKKSDNLVRTETPPVPGMGFAEHAAKKKNMPTSDSTPNSKSFKRVQKDGISSPNAGTPPTTHNGTTSAPNGSAPAHSGTAVNIAPQAGLTGALPPIPSLKKDKSQLSRPVRSTSEPFKHSDEHQYVGPPPAGVMDQIHSGGDGGGHQAFVLSEYCKSVYNIVKHRHNALMTPPDWTRAWDIFAQIDREVSYLYQDQKIQVSDLSVQALFWGNFFSLFARLAQAPRQAPLVIDLSKDKTPLVNVRDQAFVNLKIQILFRECLALSGEVHDIITLVPSGALQNGSPTTNGNALHNSLRHNSTIRHAIESKVIKEHMKKHHAKVDSLDALADFHITITKLVNAYIELCELHQQVSTSPTPACRYPTFVKYELAINSLSLIQSFDNETRCTIL